MEMKILILAAMSPLIFHLIYCDWAKEAKEVNYIFKWTECKRFNPKYGYKVTCPYKFVNRSTQFNSIEFYIHPGLKVDNVFIEISTQKKFGTVYRPILIKMKENYCNIVNNQSESFFAHRVRESLMHQNTNFLEPCPFSGMKYRYGNKNPSISFPPLIPTGEWKIVVTLTTIFNEIEEFLVELIDVWEVSQKTAAGW